MAGVLLLIASLHACVLHACVCGLPSRDSAWIKLYSTSECCVSIVLRGRDAALMSACCGTKADVVAAACWLIFKTCLMMGFSVCAAMGVPLHMSIE